MDAIAGTQSSANVTSTRTSIQQEDFLQVLLAQLQFQDPLKPMDNNEFIAQFAQLTSLEQTQQLNEKLDSVLSFQSSAQAVDLLGRTVEAAGETGTFVGKVTSLAFRNGLPVMTLLTDSGNYITDVSLGQVRIIR